MTVDQISTEQADQDTPDSIHEWITPQRAAAILDVGVWQLARLADSGQLHPRRLGPTTHRRYDLAEVRKLKSTAEHS